MKGGQGEWLEWNIHSAPARMTPTRNTMRSRPKQWFVCEISLYLIQFPSKNCFSEVDEHPLKYLWHSNRSYADVNMRYDLAHLRWWKKQLQLLKIDRQKFKSTKVQKNKRTEVPEYTSTKVKNDKSTEIQNCKLRCLPGTSMRESLFVIHRIAQHGLDLVYDLPPLVPSDHFILPLIMSPQLCKTKKPHKK